MVEYALWQGEGFHPMNNPILQNIPNSLGRTLQTPLSPRPAIYESRQSESIDSETKLFLDEIKKLSGVGQKSLHLKFLWY